MLLNCSGLELSDAFLRVSKALSNKPTNPILEGIKISAEDNELTLSATDTDLSIEKKIKADIKVEGETVVPGKFITEFVKKLSNSEIELEVNDKNQLLIRYDGNESIIQCYNVIEYPGFKKLKTDEWFGISQKDLKALISKTIFSVALDDSRPILKGVLFDIDQKEISAVALDGYRLARVKKKSTANVKKQIVVPTRSLNEISKLLDDSDDIINVYIDSNAIMIDTVDTKIISRLLEGDFVNYKQIIPMNYETFVIVNKLQLEDALERVSLLSKVGQNNFVKFDIKEGAVQLTSNSEIGNIKEKISAVLNGKDVTIAFNPRFILESLKASNDEFVKLCLNTSSNPCVIVPTEGDEFLYLILPVRMFG
ncbi:MAG TPA: DNA polymerase III subunit beta [Clostridiales bacterium]|nr:DNA polymerase III subunit beta [Clostridiales bacterium]